MSWWSRLWGRSEPRAVEVPAPVEFLALAPAPASQAPAIAAKPETTQQGSGSADDDLEGRLPAIRREPAIQIAPSFATVGDCSAVITVLDFGQFQLASWLIEQQRWNPRMRGVQNTRWDGLIGTEIRWEPGRNNALARRAARDIVEDWPLIATAATRKQLSGWGLDLGVGFAQKHWYESPTSGRAIPRLEVYHPQWAVWDWGSRSYRIFTMDGWAVVPSPSLMVPGQAWQPMSPPGGNYFADSLRRWVVHEPFGQHSWRHGFVHSSWDPWLRNTWGNRDLARGSEKLGIGIVKVKYPKSSDKTALNALIGGVRSIGSEGVLPVEVYPENGPNASYDVAPFEWSGNGVDWVTRSREASASELAILYLGHNTTAETKGASVGASAQVGNLIRGDIRISDCMNEQATIYLQVIRDWAEVNYGDPGVAPIPVYVTDPPGENQAAAQTLLNVSLALGNFDKSVKGIDKTQLLNRFRVPMAVGGVVDVPPPAPAPAGAAGAPPGSTKTPAAGDDDGNEPDDTDDEE
jgi:hypothetical protein